MKKFMRIFITIVIILICLIGAVAFFLKTVDLNQYKTKIETQLANAIKKDVTVGHIDFQFDVDKGIYLEINSLKINHSEKQDDYILDVDKINAHLNIISFLKRRQMIISKINIFSPKIKIINDSESQQNVNEVNVKFNQKHEETTSVKSGILKDKDIDNSKDLEHKNEDEMASNIDFLIEAVHLKNGSLIYSDQTAEQQLTINLEKINLDVRNISINQFFDFKLSVSLFSEKSNIKIQGQAMIDQNKKSLIIKDTDLGTDLSEISWKKIEDNIQQLKQLELTELGGKIDLKLNEIIIGEKGLINLLGDCRLKKARLTINHLGYPITDIDALINITKESISSKEISFQFADGTGQIDASLSDYMRERNVKYQANMKAVNMEKVLSQYEIPVHIVGLCNMESSGRIKAMDYEAIQNNSNALIKIDIEQGKLVDFNVLRMALEKLSFIPGLMEKINENLSDKNKDLLKQKDTKIEKFIIESKLNNMELLLEKLLVEGKSFIVKARGQMDQSQNIELYTELFVPEDLSTELVSSADELSFLLNEESMIHIPLIPYKGKLEKVRIYPDISALSKNYIKKRGAQELKKVIFDALDIGDEEDDQDMETQNGMKPDDESQDNSGDGQSQPGSVEEQLINSVLDAIF